MRHKGLSCPLSKERAVVVVLLFLLLLFMIIIIIVIFSASIAKKELRSCYGKWNFGPWTLRPGHFREEIQEAWLSFLRKWIYSMAYTKSQIKTTTIPFTIDYVVVLCQMGKKGHNRQPCRHNIRKSWQGKNRRKPSTGWCFLNFAVTIVELHH